MTRVLLVGFTPEAAVELLDFPIEVDVLRGRIAEGHAAVAAAGYELVYGWVGTDVDAGVAEVRRVLTGEPVDIVMIGNGVRGAPEWTELFERLVNAAHELAPGARFAFNSRPEDTLEALRRNT